MANPGPFTVQSPTQVHQYPPYSPQGKSRNHYNGDPQSHPPPQTPPFQPPNLSQSPHFSHPSIALTTSLNVNGNNLGIGPQSQHYQSTAASPPYNLQRPYSNQQATSHTGVIYSSSPPPHAHPSSRQGSMIQSPTQDGDRLPTLTNGSSMIPDVSTAQSRPRSSEVSK